MLGRLGLPLVVGLAVLAACSGDNGHDDNVMDITINARAVICVPQATGDLRNCSDFGLPDADVTITSNGDMVWQGKTDSQGNAEARFSTDSNYSITVTSPFIPETLESGPTSPDPALLNTTLSTDDLYVLTPLSELSN